MEQVKQTAVEWLVKELNQEIGYIPTSKWDAIADKIQQALALEKEQIIKSYEEGHFHLELDSYNPEQYYNETYGKS
jgi:hypothetical protein